jgi:hypothetical protein
MSFLLGVHFLTGSHRKPRPNTQGNGAPLSGITAKDADGLLWIDSMTEAAEQIPHGMVSLSPPLAFIRHWQAARQIQHSLFSFFQIHIVGVSCLRMTLGAHCFAAIVTDATTQLKVRRCKSLGPAHVGQRQGSWGC